MINKLSLALALLLSLLPLPARSLVESQTPVCFQDCRIGSPGLVLIKTAEGYSPFIYKDAVGIDTVGFGHVVQKGEKIKQPLMGPDAVALLVKDIDARTKQINKVVEVPLKPNQFDALSSFVYNLGIGTLQRSSMLKYINADQDDRVHEQFLRYDHAGGKQLRGLRLRRAAEADLYDSQ